MKWSLLPYHQGECQRIKPHVRDCILLQFKNRNPVPPLIQCQTSRTWKKAGQVCYRTCAGERTIDRQMLVSITLTLVDRNWEKICCLLINCFKIKLQLMVKESFTVISRTQYVYSQSCFLLFSFGALLHAKILKQHRRVFCLCINDLPCTLYIYFAFR